jgi:CopG family nickel-responsive transcriptional regulator
MSELARVSISLEEPLLKRFDRLVRDEGYPTRSEAVKALIREALVEKEWVRGREVAGAVTLVYDHHKRALVHGVMDVQHDFGDVVVATQHVHLDHHNCLEIVTVRGRVKRIQALVAALKAVKGIKHSALVMTSTGREEA